MKLLLLLILCLIAFGQKKITFDKMQNESIKSAYFLLDSKQSLKFTALAKNRNNFDNEAFIWITDLKSHKLVWDISNANMSTKSVNKLRNYDDEIKLEPGVYGFYFSSLDFDQIDINGVGDFFDKLFDGDFNKNSIRKDLKSIKIELQGSLAELTYDEMKNNVKNEGMFVSLLKMGDYEDKTESFKVKKETNVVLEFCGEVRRKDEPDFAVLTETTTNKIIWESNYRSTEYAGGGDKNRMAIESLNLKPGTYQLSFTSDDSHGYDSWNVTPPYDPEMWGVSIAVVNLADKGNIENVKYSEQTEQNLFLAIDKVGDDAFIEKSFTLAIDMDVRIFALGEKNFGDEFADYGWIVDAKTRKTVWNMNEDNYKRAGGADKNVMFDGTINLKKGSYIVYYVTDDSHSYGDGFNGQQPKFPKKWGISLYGVGKDYNQTNIKDYSDQSRKIIAQVIRVEEDEEESESFVIDKDQDVIVYCLGEASDRKMKDYGWIKSDAGKTTVWKMDYRDTEYAGGSNRNRVITENVFLKAGKYKLYYKTDNGHSYKNWNDDPPFDQKNYGITIYEIEK